MFNGTCNKLSHTIYQVYFIKSVTPGQAQFLEVWWLVLSELLLEGLLVSVVTNSLRAVSYTHLTLPTNREV